MVSVLQLVTGAVSRAAKIAGMRVRRTPAVSRAVLLVALLVLAGCGAEEPAARAPEPEQPFPPRAFEPPNTVAGSGAPEGTVVRIGGRPEGMAVDQRSGTLAVAVNGLRPGLALVDPATLAVRSTVPLPAPARHVQAGRAGTFLVPLERIDRLALVPAAGGTARIVRAGDAPHDAAQVGEDLVIGDEFGGTASVLRAGRVRGTVPVDVQPGGVAAVSSSVAAVVSVRAYTVALLDLRTLELGPSQSAGLGPSHVVALQRDGRLFIADTRGGAILEYATRPRLKALTRLAIDAPYGIAIDQRRGRLWVTDVRGGRLVLVDVRTAGKPMILRRWRTVAQPNTVAVDERSGAAIVAGQRGGELQRVAP